MKQVSHSRPHFWGVLLVVVGVAIGYFLFNTQDVSGHFAGSSKLADRSKSRQLSSGEMETFSVERTGLGDKEGSSSWKKMQKRVNVNVRAAAPSRASYLTSSSRSSSGKADSDTRKRTSHWMKAEREVLNEDDNGLQTETSGGPATLLMLKRAELDKGGRPISISRRTEEMLNPQESLQEEPEVADQLESMSGVERLQQLMMIALRNRDMGEFASRLSLLTTRKMEPEELLSHHKDPWAEPKIEHEILPDGQVVAVMDLNPNYLPRIARAMSM